MASRFVKARESVCDFIKRDRGVDSHPNHTIEVQNSWHDEFGKVLMAELPRGSWFYDSAASPRCFRILPRVLDQAAGIAKRFYANLYVTEGTRVENLLTGEVYDQRSLF